MSTENIYNNIHNIMIKYYEKHYGQIIVVFKENFLEIEKNLHELSLIIDNIKETINLHNGGDTIFYKLKDKFDEYMKDYSWFLDEYIGSMERVKNHRLKKKINYYKSFADITCHTEETFEIDAIYRLYRLFMRLIIAFENLNKCFSELKKGNTYNLDMLCLKLTKIDKIVKPLTYNKKDDEDHMFD